MKAIVQDRYGAADVLEVREIDRPKFGDHEVLIRVRAAGVNPADWAIMSGLPYVARPVYGLRRPKASVRGTDVAGVVELVGSAVTRFHTGDEVFGWGIGSFADFATAPEEQLVLKPANLTFEQAASVPMAGLVALQAVRDHGKVRVGTKVLIDGASGGIGTFAVQIAKALGAEVTGVCSTRNVDMVRSIGVDHVIDYTLEDFTRTGQKYDFILDNAGKHSLTDLRRALTATGMLVPNAGGFDRRWMASGGRLLRAMVLFRFGSQRLGRFLVSPKQADLVALSDLIEAGKLTPVIDHSYALGDVRDAMAHVAGGKARGGHARGKVTITVSQASSAALPSAASKAAA